MFRRIAMTSRRLSPGTVVISLAVFSLTTVLGTSYAFASSGCRSVKGRVIDQQSTDGQSSARMIGSIAGTYNVTVLDTFSADTVVPSVIFGISDSVVETKKGNLYFSETSSLDLAENEGLNGVALLTITGGSEDWQGAGGHLLLSGFFHGDTGSGQWDYQGEVCVP